MLEDEEYLLNEEEEIETADEEYLFATEEEEKEILTKKIEAKKEIQSSIIESSIGRLSPVNISNEVKKSFMEYAMSVIVSRAIPDARDGLKFVHRRILYSMNQLRLNYRSQYKKSARIVGDVLGKYHPHGDTSVYDAMVRMAQDFSMRYPLIDGHGNFGSADGDAAAAMRYTEARLSQIAGQMIEAIEKNTVDFMPNYDNTELEPLVLPALFPNLLIQGSSGIAVGIATKIPPHNLSEVIDATVCLAKNPDITIDELMEFIKGPDFPTGGKIIGGSGIKDAYHTGKGSIVVRSKFKYFLNEKTKSYKIIFTEIPYEIKKPKIIEKINQLISEKKIQGIREVRDESSREGIQLAVYLSRDTNPDLIISHLFKHTELQTRFNANMIALVKNEPHLLNLKSYLKVYIEHHKEVTTRRLQFELTGFENRIHVLAGIKTALGAIEKVINIIRSSENDKDSKEKLVTALKIDAVQAEAIVNLRLGRLNKLHIYELDSEIEKLTLNIAEIKTILTSPENLINKICSELLTVKEHFGDKRRTVIDKEATIYLDNEVLIPREDSVILLTQNNYIKRIALSEIKDSRIKTKGGSTRIAKYADDDFAHVVYAHSHDDILVFDKKGWVFRFKAYNVPKTDTKKRGIPIVNINERLKNSELIALLAVNDYSSSAHLITVTKKGKIKKTPLSSYKNILSSGKIALRNPENDHLAKVIVSYDDSNNICLASSSGKLVTFDYSEVRAMGRTSQGVKGITLEEGQEVVGISTNASGNYVFALGQNGYGKISKSSEYRKTKRGTKGVKTLKKSSSKTKKRSSESGKVVFMGVMNDVKTNLLVLSKQGYIVKMSLADMKISRSTNAVGEKVIEIREDDRICSVSIVPNLHQ